MFFDTENLSFSILQVWELDQTNVNIFNRNRNFYALSFRICADVQIHTLDATLHLTDNDICFFPANFEYTRMAKTDQLIVVHFDILNGSFEKLETLSPNNPEKIKRLFQEILQYWNGKERGYQYKCAAVFNMILSECLNQSVSTEKAEKPIWQAVKFMENNFNNPKITVKEIAEKAYMSEVYFRKLFKKKYKMPPAKYIIKLRLENAINLMRTGYYTLKEVAELSGYEDYSYFSSEFKRIIGVAPSEYFK